MKTIVVSAINFRSGGPLSILKDCLEYLNNNLVDEYRIIALVHNKELVSEFRTVEVMEFRDSITSYLKRCRYEYREFKKLSKQLKPYLWLSLHDMSPRVNAEVQAVYCHNASAFYKFNFKDIVIEPKLVMFALFYRYLYGINIKSNNCVIVQQSWLRDIFKKTYKVSNVLVAHPLISIESGNIGESKVDETLSYKFFFPTLPRIFKNLEVICKAVKYLKERGVSSFKVVLTIDGMETRYSKSLLKKYGFIQEIEFIGRISREKVFEYYSEVDCLLFPSKLETWGLPLSEFKQFKKPMIVADLPYAHETVGNYDKVAFFEPDNYKQLADVMEKAMRDESVFKKSYVKEPESPFCTDWKGLFENLLATAKI